MRRVVDSSFAHRVVPASLGQSRVSSRLFSPTHCVSLAQARLQPSWYVRVWYPGPRVEAGGHCSPSPLLWGYPASAMGLEADPLLLLLLLEAGCVPPVKQNPSCPPIPWSQERGQF